MVTEKTLLFVNFPIMLREDAVSHNPCWNNIEYVSMFISLSCCFIFQPCNDYFQRNKPRMFPYTFDIIFLNQIVALWYFFVSDILYPDIFLYLTLQNSINNAWFKTGYHMLSLSDLKMHELYLYIMPHYLSDNAYINSK